MEASLRPMLCEKLAEYAHDLADHDPRWVMEPKLDGHRHIAHRTATGVASYTRSGGDMTGQVPYVDDEIALLLPHDSVVDGELVYITKNADGSITSDRGYVQTVTRSNTPHRVHAHSPALAYVIFDVLRIGGNDTRGLPWQDRRKLLEVPFGERDEDSYFTTLSQTFPYSRAGADALLKIGFEGVVTKLVDSAYRAGKSWDWLKWKPQETEDCEIIGFYPATAGSKYEGNSVGGLNFRTEWGYEGRAAGMDNALRREMYENPEKFIGMAVEIAHHGRQESGALLHPQFKYLRDDKIVRTAPAPRRRKTTATKTSNRNYGAMKDEKLLRVRDELQTPGSESYERAADPATDLARVEALIADRALA